MDKKEALNQFKALVESLRNEYIENEGLLTAEFSTSQDFLPEKLEILSNNNVNDHDFGGYWFIFPCEVCKDYNEETPLHVTIIDTKSSKDYQVDGDLFRANEKIQSLEKEIIHKNDLINGGIIINPQDLAKLVSLALDYQSDLPIKDKDSNLLYLSNLVDDHFGTEDELNPLVSDEDVLAKHKELSRLDSLIAQRKKELELIEGAFSKLIPLDPTELLKLAGTTNTNTHNLIPENIRNIKYINTLLAKNG